MNERKVEIPVSGGDAQARLWLRRGAAVIAWIALAAPAAAQTPAVPLATFRSVHDLVLDPSVPSDDISAISARIVTEFTGSACKGFADQTRFVMQMTERDGTRRLSDLRQHASETAAGQLRFDQKVYSDNRLIEESLGSAEREPGGNIVVKLSKPENKAFALPPEILFPIEFARKTIAAAKDGKRFLAEDLYSGDADGETVYSTATVIGPMSVAADFGDDAPIGQSGFATMPHWPVTVSYFMRRPSVDTTPLYVSSYTLYENGMIAQIRLRYDEFGLKGTLKSFEPLAAPPCP
jgi:hypothetical protein